MLLGDVIRKILRAAIETEVNSRTGIFREVNAAKPEILAFQHARAELSLTHLVKVAYALSIGELC